MKFFHAAAPLAVFLSLTACDLGITAAENEFHPTGLVLLPVLDTLVIGDTVRMSAAFVDVKGDTVPADSVTWMSSQDRIVSVAPDGLLKAVDWGWPEPTTVTISVTSRDLKAETAITVLPVIEKIITNFGAQIVVGEAKQLQTNLVTSSTGYAFRKLQMRNYPMVWSTSDPSVVEVSPEGALRALRPGTSTLMGSYFGGVGSWEVEVVERGYEVLEIPSPSGSAVFYVTDINDLGHFVGNGGSGGRRSFLWRDGGFVELDGVDQVTSLNNSDWVLGSDLVNGFSSALLWKDGVIERLEPDTSIVSSPGDITDDGRVTFLCGGKCGENESGSVFLWENGTISLLFSENWSRVTAMNSDLKVVGDRLESIFQSPHAVAWEGGAVQTIFGARHGAGAIAVNSTGGVLAWHAASPVHIEPINARSYLIQDGMREIKGLGGFTRAMDLNDRGVIVGTTLNLEDDGGIGFLENEQGTSLLDDLVPGDDWAFTSALRINNAGQIVARGVKGADGQERTVLLSPTQ